MLNSGAKIDTPISTIIPRTRCVGLNFDFKKRGSNNEYDFAEDIEESENLSLQEKEIEMIKRSLEKNNNKRKLAAKELGISERTLYRKIKQYDL